VTRDYLAVMSGGSVMQSNMDKVFATYNRTPFNTKRASIRCENGISVGIARSTHYRSHFIRLSDRGEHRIAELRERIMHAGLFHRGWVGQLN
jgi:hypothetical protein